MYLKIILRHLDIECARENRTLYFQENLAEVTIKEAETIIKNLDDFQITEKAEIRFYSMFEKSKMVGLLVSIVVRS